MKPTYRIALAAFAALTASGAAYADHHMTSTSAEMPKHHNVMNAAGETVGTVVLDETPNGVLISALIRGLPAGEHGFHLHEKGICETSEGFTTAGGHYAPRGNEHGFKSVKGPHAGDMPNQFAGSDGTLQAHVLNTAVTLHAGAFNSLADADGTALIVHAGADDYATQPTGDAGGRLACTVLFAPMP